MKVLCLKLNMIENMFTEHFLINYNIFNLDYIYLHEVIRALNYSISNNLYWIQFNHLNEGLRILAGIFFMTADYLHAF